MFEVHSLIRREAYVWTRLAGRMTASAVRESARFGEPSTNEPLYRMAKRLLERLRDEWAGDEGASMDWDDMDLETEAATLLRHEPR